MSQAGEHSAVLQHRGLGRTFQITRLFREMTVLENVVAPLRDFSVRQLGLGAVSGSEAAQRRRNCWSSSGWQPTATPMPARCPTGSRSSVELAQVLMLDPKLILLDEPAGGINPTLIERMGDLIRELNADGKTFLLVEHNMPFVVGLCDPIRVLARGAVIAQGTPRADPEGPARARRLPGRRLPARSTVNGESTVPVVEGIQHDRTEGVVAGYGGGNVLQGVDLEVGPGELGCIVGPNGAGKSTVLRAVSGTARTERGPDPARRQGHHRPRPDEVLGAGVTQVPQSNGLFPTLTVQENILMGAYVIRRQRAAGQAALRRCSRHVPAGGRARRGSAAATCPAASAAWSSSPAR